MMTRKTFLFVVTMISALVMSFSAFADGPTYIQTGSATRSKFMFKVYDIMHEMTVKVAKNADAVVNEDCDKRFSLRFRRDVPKEKIIEAFSESMDAGGTRDKLIAAFPAEIKENAGVSISYNATSKVTTIWVQGGSTQTVTGLDEAKKIWSIWFKRIDDSSVKSGLISKL